MLRLDTQILKEFDGASRQTLIQKEGLYVDCSSITLSSIEAAA